MTFILSVNFMFHMYLPRGTERQKILSCRRNTLLESQKKKERRPTIFVNLLLGPTVSADLRAEPRDFGFRGGIEPRISRFLSGIPWNLTFSIRTNAFHRK